MTSKGPEDSIKGVGDVERAYQSANFDEQPPAHVDRAILAAARQRPRPRLAAFVPALALAATVVLSFSLMLRSGMLGIGRIEAPIGEDPSPAAEVRQSGAQEDSSLDEQSRDALSPGAGFADAPQEEGLASQSAARRERTSNEPAPPAIQERAQPAPPSAELGAGTPTTPQAQSVQAPQALRASEAQLEESALPRSSVTADGVEDCRVASGGAPADWVECISARAAGGAEAIARAELAIFVQAHPDYPLPESLRALRTP